MKLGVITVLVGLLAASANGAIKRWKGPDNNYDDTGNWDGGSLPCSADNVTFAPVWSPSTVFIQNSIAINSLILPMDGGMLVFVKSLNITLGGKPTSKCSGSNTVFKGKAPGNWDDPTNWDTLDSNTNAVLPTNTIPPSDRLPCTTDTVRFPASRSVTVRLNRPITVSQFIINNQPVGQTTLKAFLTSPTGRGQFRLPSPDAITLGSGCVPGSLCTCGTTNPDIIRTACSFAKPSCPAVTGCIGPVMMDGDCCAVCGALLNITSVSLVQSALITELSARVQGMPFKYHVVDGSHVQVLLVGNMALATARELEAGINRAPTAFGLSSGAQVVVSGSVVPTTQPPTTPEQLTVKADPGKCVQVVQVTGEGGAAVTDDKGGVVTEIVTAEFPDSNNIGVNSGQTGNTKTDLTPWYVVGGIGALLVISLIIVIIVLGRRRSGKVPPNLGQPVHYVHHSSQRATAGAVNLQEFSDDQPSIYEDLQGYGHGSAGVSNPMYIADDDPILSNDKSGIIQ
ncbi:protein amnionless-like [Sycon ciliatum]|uniref:protein amnionless-like n=1 Tax=Sycon ciliatum TaxID=27933 RepID=UPI0020AAB671|eukprot:scpid67797/ scgid31180/ Protein amnionless